MVYALVILLLYEAVARGYAFGHEIFLPRRWRRPPGRIWYSQIDSKESVSDAAQFLAHKGLIKSEFAFIFQSKFYDYDTIYPGTYTLNTSMTSKEILQLLNEKPETEDSAKPAQSGGAKAAEAKTSQGRTSEGENGDSGASGQETSPAAAAASQTVQPQRRETDGKYRLTRLPGPRSGRMPLTPRRPRPMSRPMKARNRRWKADGLRMQQRMEPNDWKMTGLRTTTFPGIQPGQPAGFHRTGSERTGYPSYAGKPQPFRDPGGSPETVAYWR